MVSVPGALEVAEAAPETPPFNTKKLAHEKTRLTRVFRYWIEETACRPPTLLSFYYRLVWTISLLMRRDNELL